VTPARQQSVGVDAPAPDRAGDELIELLQDLIRIPSVNPPDPPGADGELRVARHVAAVLANAGLRPEVHEPFPGRGSVTARLRGDGSGGRPLLLLSHLDVVPAAPEAWTRDPFGGDLEGGYVWGRGAVDMKGMIALEVGVLRLLAAEARAAGRDPASDPIPGLTRDVLFAATADEEAGGHQGIGWLVANRPDTLLAEAALNECGGVAMTLGGARFYPIGVAEKGYAVYRISVSGEWGHGSMPRPDNAAVRAAEAIVRLAEPGPVRITEPMARFLAALTDALPPGVARAMRTLTTTDRAGVEGDAALEAVCEPGYLRAARALLRDTISPTMIAAGVKYNVIPGSAELTLDCRFLPDTTEAEMRREVERRLGDLAPFCSIELVIAAAPVEADLDVPIYRLLERVLRDHDPDGIPVPVVMPFATDAKHTARLAVPTFGFSPLRLAPDERFLERFHGVDERVGVDALKFGLPVLHDVVRRFCG